MGEVGGGIGREIGAWKGAGLLGKKEEVLLNSEEEIGGGSDVETGLGRGLLFRDVKDSLLLSLLSGIGR